MCSAKQKYLPRITCGIRQLGVYTARILLEADTTRKMLDQKLNDNFNFDLDLLSLTEISHY